MLTNKHSIKMYIHCGLCLVEKPGDVSARDYAAVEVGSTAEGLQVWCTRHDCNVLHIDFQGAQHPANTTRKKTLREVAQRGGKR